MLAQNRYRTVGNPANRRSTSVETTGKADILAVLLEHALVFSCRNQMLAPVARMRTASIRGMVWAVGDFPRLFELSDTLLDLRLDQPTRCFGEIRDRFIV